MNKATIQLKAAVNLIKKNHETIFRLLKKIKQLEDENSKLKEELHSEGTPHTTDTK